MVVAARPDRWPTPSWRRLVIDANPWSATVDWVVCPLWVEPRPLYFCWTSKFGLFFSWVHLGSLVVLSGLILSIYKKYYFGKFSFILVRVHSKHLFCFNFCSFQLCILKGLFYLLFV